jgi:hypothetical protein
MEILIARSGGMIVFVSRHEVSSRSGATSFSFGHILRVGTKKQHPTEYADRAPRGGPLSLALQYPWPTLPLAHAACLPRWTQSRHRGRSKRSASLVCIPLCPVWQPPSSRPRRARNSNTTQPSIATNTSPATRFHSPSLLLSSSPLLLTLFVPQSLVRLVLFSRCFTTDPPIPFLVPPGRSCSLDNRYNLSTTRGRRPRTPLFSTSFVILPSPNSEYHLGALILAFFKASFRLVWALLSAPSIVRLD